MQKYEIPIPVPIYGLNCIDDSLIDDREAAEGTKNMSFKNGVVTTRKGYVKNGPFAFGTEPHTLYNYVRDTTRYLLAACGTKLTRQTNDTFTDISGTLATDKIECVTYPASLGFKNAPTITLSKGDSGTLVAAIYYYRITAVCSTKETLPSEEVSYELTATGGIIVKWNKIEGATGYKLYGRTNSGELLLATITDPDILVFVDDGSVTPAGAMPTQNNTATDYSDKCFIVDGANYRYFDGGTELVDVPVYGPSDKEITTYGENVLFTVPTEIKNSKYILNDNERIWVAYGKQARISHFQRPDYFPSTQIWKVEENITGMAHFMDEVIIFGDNTGTLISGSTPNWNLPDAYVYKKLPGGYGCSSHRSIVQGNNALYWANKQGVYRYRYLPSGFSIPECISEYTVKINGVNHTRSIKKLLRSADWDKCFANFYDDEYRLYIGNKTVLVFDTIGSTWTVYEYDRDFNCSMVWDKQLYYASPYLFYMDKEYDTEGTTYDGLNDDGAAIDYCLTSKFFDFGKAANKKRFKELHFTMYSELISYNVNLVLNLDNTYQTVSGEIINKVSRWGVFAFGDRITTKRTNLNYPVRIHHKGKKYNIQYKLQCNSANMAFSLMSIVLNFKMKELK